MGDGWRDFGANWSEGSGALLVTVWNPGVDESQVRTSLGADERAGRGRLVAVVGPEHRSRDKQTVVEFELDRTQHVPPTRTSYWAADDPFWRANGLDSPDFLAYVQGLAAFHCDVARFLERGEHYKVLDMIASLSGEDPRAG